MNKRPINLIAISILLLTFTLSAFAQDEGRKVQNFSGTLAPGAEKTFKISAEIGQYINAVITSEKGNVKIAEEEGATDLTAEVVSDEYDLVIYNRGKRAEKYKLTVTVYTPEPEPPERIEFENGQTEKTTELTMNPYKITRRFSVLLEAGSLLKLSIVPPSSAGRLKFERVGSANLGGWLSPEYALKAYTRAVFLRSAPAIEYLLSSELLERYKKDADSANKSLEEVLIDHPLFPADQRIFDYRNSNAKGNTANLELKKQNGGWEIIHFKKEQGHWVICGRTKCSPDTDPQGLRNETPTTEANKSDLTSLTIFADETGEFTFEITKMDEEFFQGNLILNLSGPSN